MYNSVNRVYLLYRSEYKFEFPIGVQLEWRGYQFFGELEARRHLIAFWETDNSIFATELKNGENI